MNGEQLMCAVLNAPPAIRAKLEAVLNGTDIAKDAKPDCELWSISQTARETGLCRRGVRTLIANGEIETVECPFGHPANRIRVRAASVRAFIERKTRGAA